MKKATRLVLLMSAFVVLCAAFAAEDPKNPPALRETLEKVYSDYLASVEREDAKLLISVLPSARIADLKRTFDMNGMKFPDDYFLTMRKYALVIDPPASSVPDLEKKLAAGELDFITARPFVAEKIELRP